MISHEKSGPRALFRFPGPENIGYFLIKVTKYIGKLFQMYNTFSIILNGSSGFSSSNGESSGSNGESSVSNCSSGSRGSSGSNGSRC